MADSKVSQQRKDQQHPQWSRDRQVADRLLREDADDLNLAELARLKIRYQGFPGGRDIQKDLDKVMQRWSLTEAELFAKTREIHNSQQIYNVRSNKKRRLDLSNPASRVAKRINLLTQSVRATTSMFTCDYQPGLEGIPAAQSSISFVDGTNGLLEYRGVPIEKLAAEGSFLETSYLLIWGGIS